MCDEIIQWTRMRSIRKWTFELLNEPIWNLTSLSWNMPIIEWGYVCESNSSFCTSWCYFWLFCTCDSIRTYKHRFSHWKLSDDILKWFYKGKLASPNKLHWLAFCHQQHLKTMQSRTWPYEISLYACLFWNIFKKPMMSKFFR